MNETQRNKVEKSGRRCVVESRKKCIVINWTG